MSRAASQGFVLFEQVDGQHASQVELSLVLLHLSISQSVVSSYLHP